MENNVVLSYSSSNEHFKGKYTIKRVYVSIRDYFSYSILIMFLVAFSIGALEELNVLLVPQGFVGFELIFMPPIYNFLSIVFLTPITVLLENLKIIINPQIIHFNSSTYDNALRYCIFPLLVICLRTILVSIYEVRHHGFSKIGLKMNLRILGDEKPYTFKKACLRNFIKFSGGCGLFFIPCFLPAFDGTNRTMMDKVFKIRVVEEEYFEKKDITD